jgi:hypothetical protein
MAPKRASSKVVASIDDSAKAALLAEKKGKALVDNNLQEAFEDDAVNSKRQHQDNPTPDGTVRTCSSKGASRAPPPGFAPPEGEDSIEDGEIIGISTKDQLKLRALHIKNNHLQKQKEILEANPTKIQAIMDMAPPQSTKDIQRLTGRLTALNRFISRSTEQSLPFLKTL